jgi:cation diffusion facilitator CzcD-associated flavoprotein CzcO
MAHGNFRVVVAGAGIGGLFMAERLKRAGIDFAVYEKADEVGGTWRENTFPGLFVDLPSRQYEFPFRPNFDWSRKFATGPEIQEYIKTVARERDLRRHIRFGQEIVEATFEHSRWHLKTARGDTDVADAFICATGFLHTPVMPDIEGKSSFAGPSFHSARWDHSVPIEGKRWGVIGGGASGVQITEALAYRECEVTQFIRRAQWIQIRQNPRTTWLERLKLRLPFAYAKIQKKLWDDYSVYDSWRLKPGARREAMEREFRGFLDVIRDPELRRKLTPTYHPGCTRIPKSDNYYEAVQRPNVHIETGGIEKIVPRGVQLADGRLCELDVLVYATGFDAHGYMRPMKVWGLNGKSIDEAWKDRIYSYRGVAMPEFPNLFMLYGPFSPVNNVAVPLGMEQEIDYILRLLAMARARNSVVMPTAEATEKFVARMRAALPGTVWVGCKNWYSDQEDTPILWPLPQDDHTALLADIAQDDMQFIPITKSGNTQDAVSR